MKLLFLSNYESFQTKGHGAHPLFLLSMKLIYMRQDLVKETGVESISLI